jgi:hypothetical protein
MKKPSMTRIVLGVVAAVLLFPLISLGKLAVYESSSKASSLRGSVGRTVILPDGALGHAFTGTLASARYRLNNVVGFFDLEVRVRDEKGAELVTGLSPSQLRRVQIVKK